MKKASNKAVNYTIYAADFETTVYRDQTCTEVWSSALCPVRSVKQITGKRPVKQACADDVIIHTSIEQTFQWLEQQHKNLILYYHNLKFDGSFWLDYLLKMGWQWWKREEKKDIAPVNSVETCISDLGQWYYIILNFDGFKVEMRDSLKLLPMSLKEIGKSFKTKHQKLEMNYAAHRHAGEVITSNERAYIKNDVLVLMEALEIMFEKGHTRLTIGSCCMTEYKRSIPKMAYEEFYKDLTADILPEGYDALNADEYIRKAYKGGWCYAKPDRCRKIIRGGCTADVNSLYPSVMSSESGRRYPVGFPHFWRGDPPAEALDPMHYYFIRINCAFSIKDGFLPFVQIKSNLYYAPNEMLEDSRPRVHGVRYTALTDAISGKYITNHVTLTMTCTDYKLFHEHYYVYDEKVLDGCWFYTETGIFDDYIDKYRKIKMESSGATRQIAKLFLNNLYGKMASSDESSYKRPVLQGDCIVMQEIEEHKKKPVYIPVGAAITSYAREFTIRTAQKNYKYFCYADTDSIHCNCTPDKLQGVPVDPVKFCHWKIETCWDVGWFVRAKTYIEHVTAKELQSIKTAYWNCKCAGLPDECKKLLIESMEETEEEARHHEDMSNAYMEAANIYGIEQDRNIIEKEKFLSKKRTVKDFDRGLMIYGKLSPVRISGGIVLEETYFTLR